jgi:hypothetical protein
MNNKWDKLLESAIWPADLRMERTGWKHSNSVPGMRYLIRSQSSDSRTCKYGEKRKKKREKEVRRCEFLRSAPTRHKGWDFALGRDFALVLFLSISLLATKSSMSGAARSESSHVLCSTMVLRPPISISLVYSSIARFESPTYGTYLIRTSAHTGKGEGGGMEGGRMREVTLKKSMLSSNSCGGY